MDSASVSISDMTIPGETKSKKNGRWTANEKELFIDGKLRYY